MEIDLSVDDRQLAALFTNFERPTAPLMKAIAEHLYARTRTAFKDETSPAGNKWAVLNPKYAARKAGTLKDLRKRAKEDKAIKVAKRNKILQFSGQLVDTIAAEATDTTVVLKANRPSGSYSIAAIHQLGAPRRNIPARPFFPIDSQGNVLPVDVEEIEGLVRDYFTV